MKLYPLKDTSIFRQAYRSGKQKGTKTLVVRVIRDRYANLLRRMNPEKEKITRVGISASKKVGGAVQRNRAKRLIREAYRRIDLEYGIKRGYAIVVTPRTECTVSKVQPVYRDLLYALRELGMIEVDNCEQHGEETI